MHFLNIREIREAKGLSQEEVAMQLEVTQSAYSKMENNVPKISLEKLVKISDILGFELSDFFSNKKSNIDV